ncbi:MAG: polysaccharide pyruvyl transferase family protein [Gemmatimonadaceae bacterium]
MKLASRLIELLAAVLLLPVARLRRLLGPRPGRVVIVGWWGSETVGDVAILGQLLAECAEVAPELRLTLVSFDLSVSRASLADLGRPDVDLIGIGAASGWAMVSGRCLVFGGGPLMESPNMVLWALRAKLVRWAGGRVMIYSCGIGPLRSRRASRAVAALVRTASHVVLRDQASFDWDAALSRQTNAVVSFDPAFDFARGLRAPRPARRRDRLALALRVPPARYLGDLDARREAERFLEVLARALNELMRDRPLELVGCVMHTGFADSDDHAVYERLRALLERPSLLSVVPGRHSLNDVVRALEGSQAALTVRFHGMILALATDTPFVAVDYARPSGKVSAAASLAGRAGAVVRWDELDAGELARRMRLALDPAQRFPAVDLGPARAARVRVLREAVS